MHCSNKIKSYFSCRSKIVFGLVITFILLNMIDFITAMFILPGESNPLWLLFKSKIVLFLFKILVCVLALIVYTYNKHESRSWYFGFIYCLTIGCLLLMIGITSNVMGMLDHTIVKTAQPITDGVKMNFYFNFILFFYAIPYIIAMIAFKIYDVSEKFVEYKK